MVSAQDLNKQLKAVTSIDEANEFVKKNMKSEAALLTISSNNDKSEISSELYSKNEGDIFSIGKYKYKVIELENDKMYKAVTIYLNGSEMSAQSIDSLRKIIISKYKKGTSFENLVQEYSMDGNPCGDLGWFTEGTVAKEFETAVIKHKKNDIFTADVPSSKWYFVVLKNTDDKKVKKFTVLKVKNS